MSQALPKQKLLTIREFLEQKPDENRYELHNEIIIEMAQPSGKHENVNTTRLTPKTTALRVI